MTHHDERDPLPPEEWREASSPGVRRFVLQQTDAAVRAAKDARKKPAGTPLEETA